MKQVVVGQYLVNQALPEKYRDYSRPIDSDTLHTLMGRMSRELSPAEYRDTLQRLYQVGAQVGYYEGASFKWNDLKTPPKTKALRRELEKKVEAIYSNPKLSDADKDEQVVKVTESYRERMLNTMLDEAKKSGNGFIQQIESKTRGNPADLQSLLIGDVLMADSSGKVVPVPQLRGFSEGVSPADYWVNAYGTRKGVADVKLATADAGYASKKLKQIASREVVTTHDCGTTKGMLVDGGDPDNVGSVLAAPVAGFEAGAIVTASMLKKLKGKQISVRSTTTCSAEHGVCAKCAGVRESGDFPEIGDHVGAASAQAVGERTTQVALSSKHSAGRTDGGDQAQLSGFKLIEQYIDMPSHFVGQAALASAGGKVSAIEKAPQGGWNISIGDDVHYTPQDLPPIVKRGDEVEAGDPLSKGIVNPNEYVRFKGIGEARSKLVDQLRDATGAHRRNVEALVRPMLNYVKIDEPDAYQNAAPGDVVHYSRLLRHWKPRPGARETSPLGAVGKYLDAEAGHFTVGTRVTPRVASKLRGLGIPKVTVHDDPAPFTPMIPPGVRSLFYAPDWQERLGGYYLKSSLVDAAERGMESSPKSVSYIPGLLRGTGFGDDLRTKGVY